MIHPRVALSLVLGALLTSISCAEPYQIKSLVTLEEHLYPVDINDAGVIAATRKPYNGERDRVYIIDHGVSRILPTRFDDSMDYPVAINNAGDVTIRSITRSGDGMSVYRDQKIKSLGFGDMGDINELGQITGAFAFPIPGVPPGSNEQSSVSRAFVDENGERKDLGTLNPSFTGGSSYYPTSRADALNNQGQIVGYSQFDESQAHHAFLYSNGSMTDLGTLGGPLSSARAINESGQIVGYSSLPSSGYGQYHAFLYSDGVMTDINNPSFMSSEAHSINEFGVVVGFAYITFFPQVNSAFVHVDGTTHDLNELAASFLVPSGAEGWVRFNQAAAINNFGQIVGNGLYRDASGIELPRGFLMESGRNSPVFSVKNTNRHGDPTTGVDDVAVTFIDPDDGPVLTRFTGIDGTIPAAGLSIDLTLLYDIQLEKDGVVRIYQSVRPIDVIGGELKLAFPAELHQKLEKELTKLQATGLLVLDYDTQRALQLLTLRGTSTQPELATVHHDRDRAIARLLIAAEGMNRTYAAAEPLAFDSARLITENLLAILALKKATAELQATLAQTLAERVAAGEVTARAANYAMISLGSGLKYALGGAQKALVDGTKTILPPWGAEIVNQASGTVIKGMLATFASGKWKPAEAIPEGRKGLMESLAKTLAEEVGGRVIASAMVAETQQHLNLAEVRARANQPGTGTVAQAYIASQTRAIAAEEQTGIVLDASKVIDDTTKKYEIIGDIADGVGKFPAAKLAAAIGTAIKGLNLTLTIAAAGADLHSLHEITFEDTPAVADLAFNPAALPTSASSHPGKSPQRSTPRSISPGYLAALDAVRAAIAADNRGDALDAGETLLTEDSVIEAEITAQLLRIRALIATANPPVPSLNEASSTLSAAAGDLQIARAQLYPALAGFVVPDIADPDETTNGIFTKIDAANVALTALNNAITNTEAATENLTAPAFVTTTGHGLSGTTQPDFTAPGPILITARFTNAGDVSATNLSVTLAPETSAPVAAIKLVSGATQTISTLDPGQSIELTWNATATDISADASGTAAAYKILATSPNAQTDGTEGSFEIVSSRPSFANWISGFTDLGALTDFNDDPDHDGVANGLENFFGSPPNSHNNSGLHILNQPLQLRHPRSSQPGSDTGISYEWSENLADWHSSGDAHNGIKVTFTPTVASGEALAIKSVDVIPAIEGQADHLFFRIKAASIPPRPPEPAPIAPQITGQPQSAVINQGDPATFSATVTGTGPFFYQWRKNGIDLPAANSRILVIPVTTEADQGTYQLRINAPGGNISSSSASLQFNVTEG